MRKKKMMIAVMIVGIFILLFISPKGKILAQNTAIQSRGNLVVEVNTVNFFQEDILYLKTEIDRLLNECK